MIKTITLEKIVLSSFFGGILSLTSFSQCLTTTGPTNDCGYGDAIDQITIDGTTASNPGCSGSGTGYTAFVTPTWTFELGATYAMSATLGGGQYEQGLAIWIDVNNDGEYAASEQVYNSTIDGLTQTGNVVIPAVGVVGVPVPMRVMCAYNLTSIPAANACVSNQGTYGETEDYMVTLTAPALPNVEATSLIGPLDNDCGSTTTEVWVRATNTTATAVTDVPVVVNLTGAVTTTLNATITSIAGMTFEDVMVGTINTDAGGTINVQYYLDFVDDNDVDDTLVTSVDILPISTSSQTLTECPGFSITVGTNTYTATGVYTDVLTNMVGCDSVVTTDLTIEAPIDVTVANVFPTLTANLAGATYQWLDCDNANAPIAGATNQSFSPTSNGNYAVAITVNSCTDTSACETISGLGIESVNMEIATIYPNPTNGILTVELQSAGNFNYTLTAVDGRVITTNQTANNKLVIDLSSESNGIYFLVIRANNTTETYKIIKQ